MCIHIESTTLTNGTYDLVPKSEKEQREAQVNLTEVAEEGKPRCMIPVFQFIQLHLSS
jgi:hypothetical protein